MKQSLALPVRLNDRVACRAVTALLILCTVLAAAGRSYGSAATCIADPVVTNNADSGPGSLRQAILDACPGSTITFDMNQVTSPINLSSGELLIGVDLTIQGPGAALLNVHNVQPGFRVVEVGNATVSLSGLTISGGDFPTWATAPGGGILNRGNLTLTGCTVSGNSVKGCALACDPPVAASGGGIANLGGATLAVINSLVTANTVNASYGIGMTGGGLYNAGSATIENSTVSNNSADSGGSGIDNVGTLIVSRTTISGNAFGSGAGIMQRGGSLRIRNSTISGNGFGELAANGGGIFLSGGTAEISFCTITGNRGYGGGIRNNVGSYSGPVPDGQFTISNSVLAGNTGYDSPLMPPGTSNADYYFWVDGPAVGYAKLTSLGHNIFGRLDPPFNWTFNGPGDLLGTNASPLNPVLGPLAGNGGPTLTHALLAGSPAINAGDNAAAVTAGLTTDQRGAGFARFSPVGGTVDIGAFELFSYVTGVPTTAGLPARIALRPAVPNPFNPSTTISFDLPQAGEIELAIYDLAGRRVRTLVRESLPAGSHDAVWRGVDDDGRRVPSGVYLYRLCVGSYVETRQMSLLK